MTDTSHEPRPVPRGGRAECTMQACR